MYILKFKIVLWLKTANHHLSLERAVIFLLVEGLKYFKNYQNATKRHEVSKRLLEK